MNGRLNVNGVAPSNGTSTPMSHQQPDGAAKPEALDVLIIGAGFTGCYLLHRLRGSGFHVKVVETGSDLGGVWYWNRYPGARVDSPYPVYSLSPSEIWKEWNWTEIYPSWAELLQYFDHVDKQLGLRKDMIFNTTVVSATFNEQENNWLVTCENGKEFVTKYLVAGTGFAAKRYFPKWEGMDKYKGRLVHSSFWSEDIDVKGKRLAVIGNGASGVQIAQECAKDVEQLTVFIRTPNLCLPMRQRQLGLEEQKLDKLTFPEAYKKRLETYGGLMYGPLSIDHTAHSAEQREMLFEKLWQEVSIPGSGNFFPRSSFLQTSLTKTSTNYRVASRLCQARTLTSLRARCATDMRMTSG